MNPGSKRVCFLTDQLWTIDTGRDLCSSCAVMIYDAISQHRHWTEIKTDIGLNAEQTEQTISLTNEHSLYPGRGSFAEVVIRHANTDPDCLHNDRLYTVVMEYIYNVYINSQTIFVCIKVIHMHG